MNMTNEIPMDLEINLDVFLNLLDNSPTEINFNATMALIDTLYLFTPSEFTNGTLINEAGQNSGSCKLFAFAAQHKLNQSQTLHCFGQYYSDVLASPDKEDHQNIRNFIAHGWEGVKMSKDVLVLKNNT